MMGNRLVMALIACLVIAGVMPFVVDTYFLGVALDLLMWVALAESWILLSGMTGYISLGHAVFFGAGSYVMVLCWGVLPFWLVVPLAGLVAGLVGRRWCTSSREERGEAARNDPSSIHRL